MSDHDPEIDAVGCPLGKASCDPLANGCDGECETDDAVEYVVGFAFDTRARVALIRKNRPAWQAGRLNGIGGHVEPSEAPRDAMAREFHEETGTRLDGWERFAVMDFPGARIYFYRLLNLHPIRLDGLRSTTDEHVLVLDHRDLGQSNLIPNLAWLVPLAAYTADTYDVLHIRAAMAEVIDAPEHAIRSASSTPEEGTS